MDIIVLAIVALIVAAIIKWPLILWALATIVGVLGVTSRQIGIVALAIFLALAAWNLYGGFPFL